MTEERAGVVGKKRQEVRGKWLVRKREAERQGWLVERNERG